MVSNDDLQARIDAVQWYHEFDFGNGLVARDHSEQAPTHRRLWKFIEHEMDGLDLAGKAVLDIGCWDGFWSFYAERRGAQVLATDDSTQNWAGENGFLVAHELLQSKVQYDLSRSVYDLTGLGRTFDVIFFLGVYYHLVDPFYAFAQIRHCCHENTIVVIEGDVHVGGMADIAIYRKDIRQGPRFVPALSTLSTLLELNYFEVIHEAMIDHYELVGEPAPPVEPPRVNRALRVARPAVMKNNSHYYKPPFGLEQFDLRWRSLIK